ncbi:diaminopimelate epimerase [bacterium DOLJORAL78_65_58]|nr:MAG: diaminopimelate epimerase [bacterium DOLZORAL124_64_63]PIE76110.1 MAG: diaminopimelate epimerase [bacterium DOLJORAL78_65_58]
MSTPLNFTNPLTFTKMHGAGNDFVMLDAREMGGLQLDTARIAALCDRRTGIGADGLIIITDEAPEGADFRMIYFNADGGEAEMCGNGARCSVAFAHARGLCREETRFATYSGVLTGRVFGPEDIQVSLPAYRDLALDVDLEPRDAAFTSHHTCNTGVPHLVIPVDDTEAVDVETMGRHYRQDPFFAPAGTNVNFVAPAAGGDHFLLRTYERGVEAETLACGTGASACAVVLCELGRTESPVSLLTRGGQRLQVTVDREKRGLLLRGPAVTSFHGEVLIHG